MGIVVGLRGWAKLDTRGLGLVGGEIAVILCSGLGAGFLNLEQGRDVDQYEVNLERPPVGRGDRAMKTISTGTQGM